MTDRRRWLGLVGVGVLLLLAMAASVALGARELSMGTVVQALSGPDPGDNDHAVVLDLHVPGP